MLDPKLESERLAFLIADLPLLGGTSQKKGKKKWKWLLLIFRFFCRSDHHELGESNRPINESIICRLTIWRQKLLLNKESWIKIDGDHDSEGEGEEKTYPLIEKISS